MQFTTPRIGRGIPNASTAASVVNVGVKKDMPKRNLLLELGAHYLPLILAFYPNPAMSIPPISRICLEGLRNDKRFIFQAAAHAQRAVNYFHGLQPKTTRPPRKRPHLTVLNSNSAG